MRQINRAPAPPHYMKFSLTRVSAAAFLAATLMGVSVRATPSGLNNIPTADTTGARTLVLQGFSTFGKNRGPAHFAGFKTGLDPLSQRVEWGLDSRIGPGSAGSGPMGSVWLKPALPLFAPLCAFLRPPGLEYSAAAMPRSIIHGLPLKRIGRLYPGLIRAIRGQNALADLPNPEPPITLAAKERKERKKIPLISPRPNPFEQEATESAEGL